MRKGLMLPIALLMATLCISVSIPDSSTAIVQWIETFPDPGALDDWTIRIGGFVVDNGRLTATSNEDNFITHESDNAYGWWSFDAYYDRTDHHRTFTFYFVADGFVTYSGLPRFGYALHYQETGVGSSAVDEPNSFKLLKIVDGFDYEHAAWQEIHPTNNLIEMMHIDIVRDELGPYVWLNYTGNDPETGIYIETLESLHTTSIPTDCTYLGIKMEENYTQWIDNIYVDDNPANGPNRSITNNAIYVPPEVLLVTPWAIGLCVAIGALIAWRRRQKKIAITPGEEISDSE